MPGLLQPSQHHDGQQIADMEARRGGIEADIGRDRTGRGLGVEAAGVRDLMNESAFRENLQETGLVGAHALPPVGVASSGRVV
jgi:hypothetical protein